ncbi:MAG: MurR/RpiR family transcriptional regulator [Sebaldella sp.]|nr:MurR/RpiR family transcriptional regulator [Sebaldella sp.]
MLQVKLKSTYDSLTKSEKKIANFIMKNFEKTKNMTSYEISNKVNVGQATVIRFSKKLGYSSFSELISSINKLEHEDILEKNISLSDDVTTTNTKIANQYIDVVKLTLELNPANVFEEVIEEIINAERIVVLGIGNSAIVSTDFVNKLARVGMNAFTNLDTHLQFSMITNLKKKDLLILISDSGETREIVEAAKLAKQNNTKIISITKFTKNKLYAYSDHILKTASFDVNLRLDATTSRIAQFTIIDMIFINILKTDFSKYKEIITNSDNAVRILKY